MKRNSIFKVLALWILGAICQTGYLVLHEGGHALMALIFLKVPVSIHIGLDNYVDVPQTNATDFDLAMIAIGSFILPEIVYLFLCLFKNAYISLIRIFSGIGGYLNIIMSIVILIIGTEHIEQYDILLFQKFYPMNSNIIILFLVLILLLNIILEIKTRGFNSILEKLDS